MKMIKGYCSVVKTGIIILFLLVTTPLSSLAVQLFEKDGNTYYSPFSKICTSSEVEQFIENIKKYIFQNTQEYTRVAHPLLPKTFMVKGYFKYEMTLSRIAACKQKAVPAIIDLLNSKDDERIRTALSILTDIGPDAEGAVPSLTRLLDHPDPHIKRLSAKALVAIGPAAKNAVPALIPLLQDISVLGNMGLAAKGAIPELITSSKGGSYGAGQALAKIGNEGILALIQFVVSDKNLNHAIRFTALNALDSVILKRPDKKTLHIIIPYLINTLQDKNENYSIRIRMVSLLGEVGQDSERAFSALIKALQDGFSDRIRLEAAEALKEIGKGASAVPALIQIIDGQKTEPAAMAAEILGSMGEDAVPALITNLRPKKREPDGSYWYGGRNWSVQESAATALKQIGVPAVSYLTPLLSAETDKVVRARAALILGQIGPEAQAAIPHLRPLLQQDEKSKLLAAITLAELGVEAKTVLPILIPALQIQNHEVQDRVASSIGKLGEAATSAVPALANIESTTAAEALIDIGTPAAFSFLIKCLEENTWFSCPCRPALERKESDAVPALIQALQSTNAEVRHWAASVLGKIGKDSVPALKKVLQNNNSNIRREAIYALGIINEPSSYIISSLEKILHKSTDPDEQRLAASVLDIMEYDVSWFFSRNNLVSPRNAVCPLHHGSKYGTEEGYDSSFDLYTGQCLIRRYDRSQGRTAFAIISGLADFFSDDDKKKK